MRLKFWKKKEPEPNELESLRNEVIRLQAASLLKDDIYLSKYVEFEQFKKSAYATLGAIALAHGGEYFVDINFSSIVLNEEMDNKLNIVNDDTGMTITFLQQEVKPETELQGE